MPPVFGNAVARFAETRAPQMDSRPAAAHTPNMAGMVETWRLTSEG